MAAQRKRHRKRIEWEDWYAAAQQYHAEHGDLLVPRSYQTAGGLKLGRWIERQRALYNGVKSVKGGLYWDQIKRLNDLGMVWKLEYRYQWYEWIGFVRDYYFEYGDLMVPRNYKTPYGVNLGEWISKQRRHYADGMLNAEQTADLERYDMVWYLGNGQRDWMDWYKDCVDYYAEHGDLRVPVAYVTKGGQKLGSWVALQRERSLGKGTHTPLADAQREKLDALQMVWSLDSVRDAEWEQMYQWVADYKAQNGKLPLWPRGMKAPDGRSMNAWITVQRTNLGKGRYDKNRAERLALLGILPQVPRMKPPPPQRVTG